MSNFSKLFAASNKKSYLLGDDNRLFNLFPVFWTYKPSTSCYQPIYFLRIKLGTLVNTHTKFNRKRMSITIKNFERATFKNDNRFFLTRFNSNPLDIKTGSN